jgi:hypothetical protein
LLVEEAAEEDQSVPTAEMVLKTEMQRAEMESQLQAVGRE